MSSTTIAPGPTTMAVDEITVREGFNVRQNGGGIDELAASIELLGMLVPLIVDVDGNLVAGHRRLAAARKLGLDTVPVHVNASEDEDHHGAGAAAAENILRQQLSPAEEAEAIQRMLDAGYTSDGAAQALGLSKQLVARRMVLLAIPEDLRGLWGPHGSAALSTATSVAALLEKAPGLAPHVQKMHEAAIAGARNGSSVDELARQPDEYLRRLERGANGSDPWYRVKGLPKLPKDVDLVNAESHLAKRASNLVTGPQLASYKTLEKQLRDAYIYGCELKLSRGDVDAAHAAGVTVELPESGSEYVVDVGWLRERIKSDTFPRFEKKAKREIAAAARKRNARSGKSTAGGEPTAAEKREEQRKRERADAEKCWKGLARGANLDLGRALLDSFGAVEITADVARLFAESTLGWRPAAGGEYVHYEHRDTAGRLAARGLRYVFADWQSEVPTPTKADPDRTKIEYLEVKDAEERMWKWFDAATEPGEILGRALIIHAAAGWAREEMLAQSNRVYRTPVLPTAAAKLLEKVVTPHLPASLTQLAEAINKSDTSKTSDF